MLFNHPPEYYLLDWLKGKSIGLNAKVAAGKTTLGKALECYLNSIGLHARFFPEEIDEEYLDMYLSNRKRHVFGFQKDTLNRRMAIHKEAQAFAATGGISIIDRDIFGDIAFAVKERDAGNISPAQFGIYQREIERAKLFRPDLMIHLLCDPQTALDRAKQRGNADKDAYTLQDMVDLEDATTKVIEQYYDGPLLKLEWSHNLSKSGHHDLSASGNTRVEITPEIILDVFAQLKTARKMWLKQAMAKCK